MPSMSDLPEYDLTVRTEINVTILAIKKCAAKR
jgi:hypothetical protein